MWLNRSEYCRAMRQISMAVEGSMMNSMGSRHRYLSSIGFGGCSNQLARTGSVCTFNSKSGITQKGLEVDIRATRAIGGG